MNFNETKQSAAVMKLELASATGAQQLSRDRHLQPTDHGHGQCQIHQPQAPDTAWNNLTPNTISAALKDCYYRWSPKSWIK